MFFSAFLFYSFHCVGCEAKQKVVRIVDKQGAAVILKNNKVKYVIVEYDALIKKKKNASSYLSFKLIKQDERAEKLEIIDKIKCLKATEKHGII